MKIATRQTPQSCRYYRVPPGVSLHFGEGIYRTKPAATQGGKAGGYRLQIIINEGMG